VRSLLPQPTHNKKIWHFVRNSDFARLTIARRTIASRQSDKIKRASAMQYAREHATCAFFIPSADSAEMAVVVLCVPQLHFAESARSIDVAETPLLEKVSNLLK
jgi:hypothetical protein